MKTQEHRAHELDVGAPVQGYVRASAQAQGIPQKQITDGIAAIIPLRHG
jgi:hypothetical protein